MIVPRHASDPDRGVRPSPDRGGRAEGTRGARRQPGHRPARRTATQLASSSGQASVELVILAPLFAAVVLAAAQLLAAGAAGELADHAAEAGAVALLQGADPTAAARDAVPGWSRSRMSVSVDGRRVRVRMRPPSPFPALGGMLESSREADAGPQAR